MEIIIRKHKNQFGLVVKPMGTLCIIFMFCTTMEDMKILIYELLHTYTVIEDQFCGHIYYMFPTKL